jgi:hypothetical protein
MKQRRSRKARAANRFDFKLLLRPMVVLTLIAAVALAFLSASHSLAQIQERKVLALAPLGQHVGGLLPRPGKDRRAALMSPAKARATASAIAQLAPLSPAGPRIVGSALASSGRDRDAKKAMEAAVRLSRREGTAQLWLADEAISRGDLPQVLSRYDVIMRTHPAASPQLYAALARTLVDPTMRREMTRFVSKDTPWFEGFAVAAAGTAANAEPLAKLFMASPTLPDTVPMRTVYRAVLEQLGATRKYALVASLYDRLPGAQPGRLRTVELPRDDQTQYPPVDWALVSEGGLGAAIVGKGADRLLETYVSTGAGGVAARRILLLRPGSYALRWRVIDGPDGVDAEARAIISCTDASGAEKILADSVIEPPLQRADGDPDPVSGQLRFNVPAAQCPVVLASIRVGSGSTRDEASWLFDRLSLARLAPASARVVPARN